jgi:hypothetical protein
VGYQQLRESLAAFDALLADLSLPVSAASPVAFHLSTTREFLSDELSLSADELTAKWDPRFKSFYEGQIVTKRLVDAALAVRGQPSLRSRLKSVLGEDLSLASDPNYAKDIFYELELAADFKNAGFAVELREPDVAISGCGLSDQYGVACKYPSSQKQIHAHLSKGYRQLTNQKLAGFVAIGFDQLVFGDFAAYTDFRQSTRHPLEVMQSAMDSAMANLVKDRADKYPSEPPVDGALCTLRASGIYGEPARLTTVTAISMQCDSANPMVPDIAMIHRQLCSMSTSV